MRALAIILAIVGVSSAATLVAMDEQDLERVMMGQIYGQDPKHPFMGVGTLMTAPRQEKDHDAPVAEEGIAIGEREARDAEEPVEDSHAENHRRPFNMFENGMMAMFPMMYSSPQNYGYHQGPASNGYHNEPAGNGHAASNGNGYGATPYAASKPASNGHAVSGTNGNGNKRPTNGQSRPGNGQSRPNGNGNGNGKRGGSASAASAGSFNRGSGSFSQAQAFSGNF